MLNTELDLHALRQTFKKDKRLVIDNFLEAEVAERLHEYCLQYVPFDVHYVLDGQNKSTSQADMLAMSEDEKRALNTKIFNAAAEGSGFLYCAYRMSQAAKTDSKELKFLHDVFDYFNSEELIAFIKKLTGDQKIAQADAHYTRFTPGQFLTRHRDVVAGKDRRCAYVMGFTKGWHPDWGGLLQFYEEDGTPELTLAPKFNALSIFDTRYIHAVTCVAPFARVPRLSLTGWFRAKPEKAKKHQGWNVSIDL